MSDNQTATKTPTLKYLYKHKTIINIVILLLVLCIVIPQIDKFRSSFSLIIHVNPLWLIAGFIFSMMTYLMSSLSYYVLSAKPIKYSRTVLTQGASMFANHLLPAGIGSMGVSYQYLRKNHHSKSEAAAIVYINNVLGFIGYVIIISYIILFTGTSLHLNTKVHINKWIMFSVLLIIFVIIFSLLRYKKLRQSLSSFISQIHKNIYGYRKNKLKLVISLLSIMSLTILYGLSLCSCALAIGIHISLAEALIVLAFGVIGKTVAPTPGGLIGAEAAIFAGLVAFGSTAGQALVIILTYRLLTYWIPFAIGAVAFARVKNKQYI